MTWHNMTWHDMTLHHFTYKENQTNTRTVHEYVHHITLHYTDAYTHRAALFCQESTNTAGWKEPVSNQYRLSRALLHQLRALGSSHAETQGGSPAQGARREPTPAIHPKVLRISMSKPLTARCGQKFEQNLGTLYMPTHLTGHRAYGTLAVGKPSVSFSKEFKNSVLTDRADAPEWI